MDGRREITIGPTRGRYAGIAAKRHYRVRLEDQPLPEAVTMILADGDEKAAPWKWSPVEYWIDMFPTEAV